ncbi:hypothetical protein DW655_03425 [Lachnospiraceae bacterium AM23-2LB]|nr:hypothetical protein DW655_03425 [Lachnospiraceae bacterium AM23-2LB]RJW02864.1 hypothetical protein DW887_08120 [Lachnospiraceae bacterium AM40-2BH]
MCGKGRAEPLICLMQIVELVRQTALSKSAIRRAKRAEENAEHLARLRQSGQFQEKKDRKE